MEQVIGGLLKRYETGQVSRRELVGTLAALSVTGGSAWAAPAGFTSASINHVSIVCSDLQRTVEYYSRVFGLAVTQNQPNLVQLGVGKSQHLSIRREDGPKRFDHFAIGIDGFNKDSVIADLKARGATPIDGGAGAGLHVADPDGLNVQVIANAAG